jgi:RNA polymerase sigma-70 factor (ECF subfamily)
MPNRNPLANKSGFLRELEPIMDGLYRQALRMTGNAHAAEDVTQEAILKGYRFFESYQAGTNFRAWMHRVLYTVFVNKVRERSLPAIPLEAIQEPAAHSLPLVDELDKPDHAARAAALLEATDDRIKRAVMDLPEDLRTVFLLSTVEELKYREIARVMDCPLGTVMSRLFRGRRLLQERLAEYAKESGFPVDALADEGEVQ